jgi:hypothetical protein
VALFVFVTGAGCKDETLKTADPPPAAQLATMQSTPMQLAAAPSATNQNSGTVVEVIHTGNYTYVQVDTGGGKIWAAAPTFQVKSGDKVVMPQGMPMRNFQSKTLNRTFDLVYFVPRITVAGSEAAGTPLPEGHPRIAQGDTGTPLPEGHPRITQRDTGTPGYTRETFAGIEKPEGGKTIAELYAEKTDLAGKEVVIRGKVVKFTPMIMGKNWIHVEDGTGSEGTNNLTITTRTDAKIGDTIVARGVVVTDKDYGYGYKYAIIIEDARVTVE